MQSGAAGFDPAAIELGIGADLDKGTVELIFHGRTATLSPDAAEYLAAGLLAGEHLMIAGPGHPPLLPSDVAGVADALRQSAEIARYIRNKFN